MIDLSYLTVQEQEMIKAVLKRDAELKKAEEERIRKLKKTLRDRNELKYMSGEWFNEAKSRRHRGRPHGLDTVSASLGQKKPATLVELTQTWNTNPSLVNSRNLDVFVPAELSGLIDEPPKQPKEKRGIMKAEADKKQPTVSVPTNQRTHMSGFTQPEVKVNMEMDGQLVNGAAAQVRLPEDEQACYPEAPAPQVSDGHSSEDEQDDVQGPNPVRRVPRLTFRPMATSKSLEDMLSFTTPSTTSPLPAPSFSDPEQLKRLSMSVPAFVLEENGQRDSDSENSMRCGGRRRADSSTSGMASVSSVSSSVMSIYSGEFDNVEVKGSIEFAISYIPKLREFHIFVVQCKDLAIGDAKKNRSDPYVKSYLLPDKAKLGKRKTTVKKKTLNPTYNEILRYSVTMETIRTQTLNLSVWHNDTFGRNSFLGEVEVDLSKWDFGNTRMNEYTLKPRTSSGLRTMGHRGEMRVALSFQPCVPHSNGTGKTGELQVWVKDCKDLPMIRGAAIDPFVKCTLLPDTNKKSRQKTRVLRRTPNPVFNQNMVYDGLGPEDLREICVELTVWDHERLNNHFLGGLRLSLGTGKSYGTTVNWMDSNSDETSLWERMMDCHNEWVEDVLPLRMLIMARSMSK